MTIHKIFDNLLKFISSEDVDLKEKTTIQGFIQEQKSDFLFVLAGKTQSGKSTLINLLFDPDPPQAVHHGKSTTRKPREIPIDLGKKRGKLTIVDLPGICESVGSRDEIEAFYKKYLPIADAILWLSRVDVSADECDQIYYNKLSAEIRKKIVFGVSQLDAARGGSWHYKENEPSKKQLIAIRNKLLTLKTNFNLSNKDLKEKVVCFSSSRKYNIDKLEFAISSHIEKSAQFGLKLSPTL